LNGDGVVNSRDAAVLVQGLLNTFVADTNLDHTVDLVDLTNLAARYGQSGGFANGDTNGDGRIDLVDLVNLANVYGRSLVSPVGQTNVPEPTTAALAWLGGAALIGRRRHRRFPAVSSMGVPPMSNTGVSPVVDDTRPGRP
jgi:hypothetical protein